MANVTLLEGTWIKEGVCMCAFDFFQPLLCEFMLLHSSFEVVEINGILCASVFHYWDVFMSEVTFSNTICATPQYLFSHDAWIFFQQG